MTRGLLAAVMLVLVAACGRTVEVPEKAERYWACDGLEFAAFPMTAGVDLYLPGRDARLVDETVFHRTDTGAELTLDGRVQVCTPKRWGAPWQAAEARGAVFRAIGQEPGWHIEVVPGASITLVLDYGERTVAMPVPELTLLGGARGYHALDARHNLMLLIEDLPCFDTMSGEVFPETVTVALDGERFSGCGLAY